MARCIVTGVWCVIERGGNGLTPFGVMAVIDWQLNRLMEEWGIFMFPWQHALHPNIPE